ncbi:uncharacterized protein LOC110853115 isoform X2 [Folsomia candida]|nr:uncharacterized protein LOC110853115 isoform X2 [Folsomia candida]XP_035710601.1 uncharacterized protein LOC110853115 isoform X2 [Folsomia candida]
METFASTSMPVMNDSEIQDRVSSLAGPNARILDCEKKSSLITEEVLLLNGVPVRLVGEAGERIKAALKAGQPPPPEILSEILIRSGIQTVPVQVETVTTVKSNTKTSEISSLTDSHGILVDEKMKEFEEDDEFESTNVEIWEKEAAPPGILEQMEAEKNKMWDFYTNGTTSPKPPGKNKKSSSIFTNATENSDKFKTTRTTTREPNYYENMHQVPNMTTSSSPTGSSSISSPRSSPSPTRFYQRVEEPCYANVEKILPPPTLPRMRASPGKMPPLSIPSDPKLRPPVPPKPAGIRLAKSGYVGNLRTDKNISLPVRVVYETFI